MLKRHVAVEVEEIITVGTIWLLKEIHNVPDHAELSLNVETGNTVFFDWEEEENEGSH